MTVYHLTLETSHFSFDAYGQTAEEARQAMRRAVAIHIRQTGADPEYFSETDWSKPRRVLLGHAYRDGERVR